MIEINSGNEALTQLRPYWDKVLVAVMKQAGIREITLDAPDFERLFPAGRGPIVVVLGRKHIGDDGGFTLCIADTRAEMVELVAKHQGNG